MAANRAPTWLRWSEERRSSWCFSDGLMEVMAKGAYAKPNPKWVEHAILPPPQSSSLPLVARETRWGTETEELAGSASLQEVR